MKRKFSLRQWLRVVVPISGLLALAAEIWGTEIKDWIGISPLYVTIPSIIIAILIVVIVYLVSDSSSGGLTSEAQPSVEASIK